MKGKLKKLVIFVLIVTLFSGVVRAELVAHWGFDFGDGRDSCGDNHGIFYGDPYWITGRVKYALQLDGVDDYIDCGDYEKFNITDKATVTAWVKTNDCGNSENNPYIVNGTHGIGLRHHALSNLEFMVHVGGIDNGWHMVQFPVDSSFNNIWHHLAGTYDGRELRIYVDGELKEVSECKGYIKSSASSVNIGRNPQKPDRFYEGVIDDVRIYNHALTEDEVKELYDQNKASFVSVDYLTKLVEQSEAMIKNLEPQETVAFLDKKIAEFEKWKATNQNKLNLQGTHLPSDMYVLLARAKEATGTPMQDVISTYKQSVSRPQRPSNYIPATLLWLSEKISRDEYIGVVKGYMRNSENPFYDIYQVAKQFESVGSWAAFELFLDAVLSEVDDPLDYLTVVDIALKKDGVWAGKFIQYCRSKPELMEFILCNLEKTARNHIEQKDFDKAIGIYTEIIKESGPNQNKSSYEFKVCECLFNSGRYEVAVKKIDNFIEDNKATSRTLISKALMLKGQAYVQLGKVDQAIDTFLTLLIEYPRTKQAPEANFFIGYCYMLQGKFPQAMEAFNLLMEDYPQSSYIAKAESYINRIKNMTD